MAPEHCPRCIGRRRVATPLFESELPMRRLVADASLAADSNLTIDGESRGARP
jgi:hypothetical protein